MQWLRGSVSRRHPRRSRRSCVLPCGMRHEQVGITGFLCLRRGRHQPPRSAGGAARGLAQRRWWRAGAAALAPHVFKSQPGDGIAAMVADAGRGDSMGRCGLSETPKPPVPLAASAASGPGAAEPLRPQGPGPGVGGGRPSRWRSAAREPKRCRGIALDVFKSHVGGNIAASELTQFRAKPTWRW